MSIDFFASQQKQVFTMPSDRQHARKKQPVSQRKLRGSNVRRIVEIGHKLGKVPPWVKVAVPSTLLFLNVLATDVSAQKKPSLASNAAAGLVKKAPKFDISKMTQIAEGVYLDNTGTKIAVVCTDGEQRDRDLASLKGPDGKNVLDVLNIKKFDLSSLKVKRYVNSELGIKTQVLFSEGASGIFYVNQHAKSDRGFVGSMSLVGTEICSNYPIIGEGEFLVTVTKDGHAMWFSALGRGGDVKELFLFKKNGKLPVKPKLDVVEGDGGKLFFEVSEFGIEEDIPIPKLPPASVSL